jgi:hypothetical protein
MRAREEEGRFALDPPASLPFPTEPPVSILSLPFLSIRPYPLAITPKTTLHNYKLAPLNFKKAPGSFRLNLTLITFCK